MPSSLSDSTPLALAPEPVIGEYSDGCLRQSRWQYVVHGQMGEFRRVVCRELELAGDWKRAKRFALCGTGDEVEFNGKTGAVHPKRCGHPLCPRCSRYRGVKFVGRVQQHLRARGHGALYHMVLTQQIQPQETFVQSRERFEKSFKPWSRYVQEQGVRSMLAVTHVCWSHVGGWHVHKHALCEFQPELGDCDQRAEFLQLSWADFRQQFSDDTLFEKGFVRKLSGPGERMSGLPEGEGDFWSEARSQVEVVLQYAVRDVCQGTDGWKLQDAGDRLLELVGGAKAFKFRRLYGAWRNAVPASELAALPEAEAAAAPARGEIVGRADRVLRDAERGIGEAVRYVVGLLDGMRNKSAVQQRLVQVTRFLRRPEHVVAVA